MNKTKEALALRLLKWFCPDHLYEEIEGDLIQKYGRDAKKLGARMASRRLLWNALRFFRPGIILRNKFRVNLTDLYMLRNYLTVSFRNVWKSKVFSAINICGLGIGLAACLLIFQFVTYHLGFDKFNANYDHTYRVTNDRFQNGKLIQHGTITYPTIGPTMAKDFPEIERATRLMPGGTLNIKVGDNIFREGNCIFTDENFLAIFSFPMLAGEPAVLNDRYAMVLTEKMAVKYFGKTDNYSDYIGKTLYWGLDTQPYTVKGICKDVPRNSHLHFDALVAYTTLFTPDNPDADISWTWSDMWHYVLLKPGVDYKALEAKFPGFSDRYFQGEKVSGSTEKFYLQPLKDVHLYSDYEYELGETANGKAVWAVLIIALFILVLAWINYINLTTSRAIDRAKEVGIRKVMGALKSQLVRQFIFESMIISAFAFVLAVGIVQLSQKSFNDIVGGDQTLWKILADTNASTIGVLVIVLLAGVLLAGFYPAFVLSAYQPATVLKGKFQRSSRGQLLRKGLVVFQFTSSAALITGTLIVSKQISYMSEADLGLNIARTVIVQSPERTSWDSTFIQRVENYKAELLTLKGVESATTTSRLPGERLGRSFNVRSVDQPSDVNNTLSFQNVDHNFFASYGVKILAGRGFLPTDHKVDWQKLDVVVLNTKALALLELGTPENAIGKEVFWGGDDGTRKWTVVGVVRDFHQESLKKPMEPMIFRPVISPDAWTSIKIKGEDTKEIVASIETTFRKFFPDNGFEYSFLEDRYKWQYQDDDRFSKVISIFTGLAIIISCLGLIGLSSYTAVQRTREIGIRKVLGASLFSIVTLLSVDFIRLVLLATVLAVPIAYFGASSWLESYAYKISPGWLMFIVPILVILTIAAITMSFQVLKTALTNPAETLKYE